ncbi:RDD family protein [Pseudonocardia sp. RS010]|uniref:RDD family protein n=1 Tax=Pseudonocardia sp. RS010 TaxID=3385979 RepID=UPI0039A08860
MTVTPPPSHTPYPGHPHPPRYGGPYAALQYPQQHSQPYPSQCAPGQPPHYAVPSGAYPPPPALPRPDYASWGARVGSALVDGLIPGVVALLGLVGPAFSGDPWVVAGISVAFSLAAFVVALWNSCYRQGRTGQSLGKQLIGTRLIRARDGGTLGFWATLARQLAHVLDSAPLYLGYLWLLWDERRQTFADKVCETVVVRAG